MKHIVVLLAMNALLIVGCGTDDGSSPEDTTSRISFDPNSITISAGDSATVSVNVENLPQGIFALATQIEFNSNSISISEESFQAGDYFEDDALTLAIVDDTLFNVAVTNTRSADIGGSDGDVFSFRIRTESSGSSVLSLIASETLFYDEDGNTIEVPGLEFEIATVTVTN